MNQIQQWKNVRLRVGLQKSMPALIQEIKKIEIVLNNHKLYIGKVEIKSPKELNISTEIIHLRVGTLVGETINTLNAKLHNELMKIEYQGKRLITEARDGFF